MSLYNFLLHLTYFQALPPYSIQMPMSLFNVFLEAQPQTTPY